MWLSCMCLCVINGLEEEKDGQADVWGDQAALSVNLEISVITKEA